LTDIAVTKTYPVVEVFGPVVQGEGPVAGQVTHFVRFGLCDYRCSWCDSMYAVDPKLVKANAERLKGDVILGRVLDLGPTPWVTFSGGNPAMHDLEWLMRSFQLHNIGVCVETQGSVWQTWLGLVNMLVVSPKPPSSGMVNDKHRLQTDAFMLAADDAMDTRRRAIKIVVFDEEDLHWAEAFLVNHPWSQRYLSVGTPPPLPGETLAETRQKVCDGYRWLSEQASNLAVSVTVLPQLHVLAYGHQRGV